MYFDTLPKHTPVSHKKHTALLSILIKEFESRFQDGQKNHHFFPIFVTPLSVDINTLLVNFQTKCIELQSEIQLKEKSDHVSY